MKVFIPLLCLASLAFAEPPVSNGYPVARSSQDNDHYRNDQQEHHSSEHQRSLSQEYGPPSLASRNSLSDIHDTSNARSALSPRPRAFAPPSVRVTFNQKFGSAASRSSTQDQSAPGARRSHDEAARKGISQGYTPAARLSQEYGVPSDTSRSLSGEYGLPNTRSTPSEEYGAPAVARSGQNYQSPAFDFRRAQSSRVFSQDHSTPSRSQFQSESSSHDYSAPSERSNELSQGYETLKPFSRSTASKGSQRSSPSTSKVSPSGFGARALRNSNQERHDSISQSNSRPSQRGASQNGKGLSQENRLTSSRSNLRTEAVAAPYAPANARSAPSSSYLPASRNARPSEQYGVPEQSNQGYDDAKTRALNELLNQEPANYDFAYQIEDQESGSDFGHTETREENRAEGSYFVVLPDGTKQTVEYEADENGFKPRISVEPAPGAGGYDDNAQDVASRAAEGPY